MKTKEEFEDNKVYTFSGKHLKRIFKSIEIDTNIKWKKAVKKLKESIQKEIDACKGLREPLSTRTNPKLIYAQKLYEKLLEEIDKIFGSALV